MDLLLNREPSNEECTLGKLYIDGEYFCETLEDPVRDRKIATRTAIPAGKYKVVITPSPRFNTPLPLLMRVPGFTGIRIHAGNWAKDTDGCILVGMERQDNRLYMSKMALSKLIIKISRAIDANQPVWITIVNA